MNSRKKLRIFRTIYLWIFVLKVLQARGERYRSDTKLIPPESEVDVRNGAGGVMIKPLTLQLFDDYTDELVNERGNNVVATTLSPVTTLWQTIDKHIYANRLPLITTNFKTIDNNNDYKHDGNSLTSKEINFENFNVFGRSKVNSNAFWPKPVYGQHLQQQQQQQLLFLNKDIQPTEKQRHSLLQIYAQDIGRSNKVDGKGFGRQQRLPINIRHKILPLFIEKYMKTKNYKPTTTATLAKKSKVKKSNSYVLMANNNENNERNDNDHADDVNIVVRVRDAVKENLYPLKDDEESSDTLLNVNVNGNDDDNGIADSKGNGNESLNYADNGLLNTNYLMAQSNNDIDREPFMLSKSCDKRAKPSVGHTPFLPAISGGAMTNLGKFFRDLSKNVHFSEQFQWSDEHQKLLEGDPNFSNIQHHLEKPNAATDQQTAEWIKAIRFYRPSQKIRSLVAMNPHGNWDHSSQFIDPNYMWVGLGK